MTGPALRDIHVPPAAWWPPAPGWWLLAGIVVLAVIAIAWWRWRRARTTTLRATLAEIDRLAAAHARNADAEALADGASRLLRRVALRVEPGAAAAAGAAWRAFVGRYARDASTRATLDALLDARFRAGPALDGATLIAALRAWCRAALAPRALRAARTHAVRGEVSA